MADFSPAELAEGQAVLDAVAAEYSVWVAAEVIYLGGVRAFNPGSPVPVSHVRRGIVRRDQVWATADGPLPGLDDDLEQPAPYVPPGADSEPDPDDAEAAAEANRAAGVI